MGSIQKFAKKISRNELYGRISVDCQLMNFNNIYQLHLIHQLKPETDKKIEMSVILIFS